MCNRVTISLALLIVAPLVSQTRSGSPIMGPNIQGGGVYNAAKYGWLADGADHSTEALALLSRVYSDGGGTICFPAGALDGTHGFQNSLNTVPYRSDSQLLWPPDGIGIPGSELRLTTCGGARATLDLRYQGGNGGKIELRTVGWAEIDHLVIVDKGAALSYSVTGGTLTSVVVASDVATATFSALPPGGYVGQSWSITGCTTASLNGSPYEVLTVGASSFTFSTVGVSDGTYNNSALTMSWSAPTIHDVNTWAVIHDNLFFGNNSPVHDHVVLGSPVIGQRGDGRDGIFQGYPTSIYLNSFSHGGRGVYLRLYANSINIDKNQWEDNKGTRAIELNGGTSTISGSHITSNLIEMENNYLYGIVLTNATSNTITGNSIWDGNVVISDVLLTTSPRNIITFDQTSGQTTINGDAASMNNLWSFGDGTYGHQFIRTPSVQVLPQPSFDMPCDSAHAMTLWYSGPSAGLADALAVCVKNSANTWLWRALHIDY